MDKNAIKKYAVWARREFISRVSQKAQQFGITEKEIVDANADSVNGRLLSPDEKKQRQALIAKIKREDYEQVMEEVAYTWFNRFSALRFMEVNGYLPSHVRVFTDDEGSFKPQILAEAIHLDLDGLDMDKVYALKEKNDDEALFKYLIITQCNALSAILPGVFQKIADYTELLFPDNLLRNGSVLEQMISLIPEEDWKDQVQIIGWLYQYYNTEPKDKVFADLKRNIKITKEKIPAATQLFTPDWIVRYMVENSLGRLWVEGHPSDELKTGWKYYLEEAKQEPEVQVQLDKIREEYKTLKPEDIKCIDPCMGSGHILVYLFDVLMQIYSSCGYSDRDAVRSIIENNLYGLDIDDRAAQLAYFSVMMKARQYDARFFSRKLQPHVYAICESNGLSADMVDYFVGGDAKLKKEMDSLIIEMRDAKEYGSILNITPVDFRAIYARFDALADEISIYNQAIFNNLLPFVRVAQTLAQKYETVVTNPPYMGAGNFSPQMMAYIKGNYFKGRTDLFAVFIKKCKAMTTRLGFFAMITMQAWMFQSSFLELRNELSLCLLTSLLHLGAHAFEDLNGEIVQTVAFVFSNSNCNNYVATCVDDTVTDSSARKEYDFLNQPTIYQFNIAKTLHLPGKQYAYWITNAVEHAFINCKSLSQLGKARRGLQTGNAPLFIRYWYELSYNDLTLPNDFIDQSTVKWVLENNGGEVKRWYSCIMNAVLWHNNGMAIKNCPSSIIPSEDLYFKRCITWNKLTTKGLALKLQQPGIIPGDLSPFFIANSERDYYYCFGLLNSCVAPFMMRALNPTITTPTGDVSDFPVIACYDSIDEIQTIVETCVNLSREDSAVFETSWDFERHPLIRLKDSMILKSVSGNSETRSFILQGAFNAWEAECDGRFKQIKAYEEELNRIFIDIYGLQDELTPEVEDKDVTVRKADLKRDVRSLISYAVGCMFGRYSLDVEGLVYAGGEWDATKYTTFPADRDNIIPICDDEYFEDDITGRFVKFIETVYGKDTLDENLRFIADALGGSGQPKDVIRNYFLNDFYADHLKIYQKRPIYWLFDSGKKNGFKALIYMHRYAPDTLARMRTDYVHEQQARYRTAIADVEHRMENASASERVKLNKQLAKLQDQAEEIRLYEEKIHHLADQMIRIDLDDGVNHNYAIFEDVLAKIK